MANRALLLKDNRRSKNFFKQVYGIVKSIPRGKVLTYGQIATLLGAPAMARQVGWAMHGCPQGLPWQRVVGAGGKILINSLSAPGGGPLLQRSLLEMEGIRFKGKAVDLDAHQYFPPALLKLKRNLIRDHRKRQFKNRVCR
jgi:methylated-DNA-protein-cysteine methyltransferase related protein